MSINRMAVIQNYKGNFPHYFHEFTGRKTIKNKGSNLRAKIAYSHVFIFKFYLTKNNEFNVLIRLTSYFLPVSLKRGQIRNKIVFWHIKLQTVFLIEVYHSRVMIRLNCVTVPQIIDIKDQIKIHFYFADAIPKNAISISMYGVEFWILWGIIE